MVDKIKSEGKKTLTNLEAFFNTLVIISELAGATILAVYACTFNEFGYLLAATVAVASFLAADALLKIYRKQKNVY